MGELEKRLLENSLHKPLPQSWKRFIDDITFIWPHGDTHLTSFKDHLNSSHPTIKFTFVSSNTSVPFLDTLTELKNGRIETQIYSKPTDTHSYLLPTSCHAPHTFKSIPYSQAIRIRRICSTPETTNTHLCSLTHHLTDRGYNPTHISDQIDKAKLLDRTSLLTYKQKKQLIVPFVTKYYPSLHTFNQIFKDNLHLLQMSQKHFFS